MRLDFLGHASWLVEAAGLRLLFDPLLFDTHHAGTYGVLPRRDVDAEALRADFVLVSHRHTDHFDVRSLHRLAALDPASVVVTPDPLVAWAARALGFETVRELGVGQRVDLDGVRFVTTPSTQPLEWGALIDEPGGPAVWNQVDTGFRSPAHLRATLAEALRALERDGEGGPELALVRWEPMLEIQAPLAGRLGFPYAYWGRVLEEVKATRARAVVPSACGARRVGPCAWMNAHAYPVSEARFARDLTAFAPSMEVLPPRIGDRFEVRREGVEVARGPYAVARDAEPPADARPAIWRPFEIPPLADPERGRADEATMRARCAAWIEEDLAPGLARAWPTMAATAPLRLAVEVVFAAATDVYTLIVGPDGARVERHLDPDWDALNAVAGSLLFEVVEGRLAWGDVLLGGMIRAAHRAYRVDEAGLARARVGEIFLYHGLGYDLSTERAIRFEVAALLGS